MVSLIKIDFLVFLWYNSLIYNKEEKLLGTLEGFLGFVMLIVILITINIILWTSEFQKEKRKNEGEKSEDEKKRKNYYIRRI